MSEAVRFLVIAKEPVPGRVKTRLCPPCSPTQAAAIAEASLRDTIASVRRAAAAVGTRPLLVLEGEPPDWLPDDVDVIAQEGDGLDERLTAAFAHVFGDDPGRPAVLVGMDTPQVTADDLLAAADLLRTHDAVLGPAPDGGYWLIGLRRLEPGAITGVPMSRDDTFVRQVERLSSCGYRTGFAATFVDVDDAADARAVADLVPGSRFADAVRDAVGPTAPLTPAGAAGDACR